MRHGLLLMVVSPVVTLLVLQARPGEDQPAGPGNTRNIVTHTGSVSTAGPPAARPENADWGRSDWDEAPARRGGVAAGSAEERYSWPGLGPALGAWLVFIQPCLRAGWIAGDA